MLAPICRLVVLNWQMITIQISLYMHFSPHLQLATTCYLQHFNLCNGV